jgi:hypothetical protein
MRKKPRVCISGSIAPPKDATKVAATGGAATTSTAGTHGIEGRVVVASSKEQEWNGRKAHKEHKREEGSSLIDFIPLVFFMLFVRFVVTPPRGRSLRKEYEVMLGRLCKIKKVWCLPQ